MRKFKNLQRMRRVRDGVETTYVYHRQTRARLTAPEGTEEFARQYEAAEATVAHAYRRAVYFAEAVGLNLIKIGIARAPAERVAELAIGCPVDLVLLGEWRPERASRAEAELHRRFAEDRVRGEWFAKSPALMELITNVCGQTSFDTACQTV